jgi:spermidine/putrescine transport system ATP-binding protein
MIKGKTMKQPIVSLVNITKSFDNLAAIDKISLDVYPGEFLTLLGPSGCGKTTILRLIAGFEDPTHGDIFLNGVRVNGIPANKRDVNTVFQSYALFPHKNVFDNIAFGLKIKKLDQKSIDEKVCAALELVKLTGFEHRSIHQLSGGQQQRVAFARAFVNQPLVLLLDEPLSALDYRLRKEMQLEIRQLQRKLGITFVFVTHDQEEAITMSDRIVVMNHGKIEQDGTPKSIYEEPANLFVAKFVGEINVFDGRVISLTDSRMIADVEGVQFDLLDKKGFAAGQKIKVLLRPEDLLIKKSGEGCKHPYILGSVQEMIYKGTTVDVLITINSGKTLLATEFFNENFEDIRYEAGETVCINWVNGWEAVLPDD